MKTNPTNRSLKEPVWALLPLLLAAAGPVLALTGCNRGGADGPPPEVAMPVFIQTPARMAVEETLSAVGTVEARESVDIQPEVSGLIEDIQFEEGDHVVKGQRLFSMNSRSEAAVVAQAKAELQLAKSNLERAKTLIGTKAISEQELDQLESLVAVKSAILNAAEQALSERTIQAPFDGQLGPRKVSPGQYVNAGTSLVTLVDDSTVKVRFRIPERQRGLLRTGQAASLTVAAWPDRRFTGEVDLIDPVLDQATRTVEIRLLAANPDQRLQAGMFARVAVVVETRLDSLVIPEAALVPSLNTFSVYRVEEGRARLSPVTLGVRLPGTVEVLSGLTTNSEIVASGIQKIVDGMKVVQAPAGTNALSQSQ